jgi:hypothetical protein
MAKVITAEDCWFKFCNKERFAIRFTTIDEARFLMNRFIELGLPKSPNLFSQTHINYIQMSIDTSCSMMITNAGKWVGANSLTLNQNSVKKYMNPYPVYNLSYDNGFGVDL